MLGQYFQSLNSIEYIANQFTQSLFGDRTLFDLPEIIDSIQMKDVLAAGEAFISEEASSLINASPAASTSFIWIESMISGRSNNVRSPNKLCVN